MELKETPITAQAPPQIDFSLKSMIHALSEKPKALNREQLAVGMTDMAAALTGLIDIIRYYPDAPKAQLLGYFERTAKASLTPAQKELVGFGLDIYEERHQAVKKVRQQHPNDPELFNYLFGKPPKGKIEVIQGPITLYFRCHKLEDYALIYNGVFEKPTSKKPDSKEAKKSRGVALKKYRIPELKTSIMAENAQGDPFDDQAQSTLIHEEQHQILNLFKEAYHKYSLTHLLESKTDQPTLKKLGLESIPSEFNPRRYQILAEQLKLEADGIRQTARVADFIRQGRKNGEALAKNEILAYFKEGTPISQIQKVLSEPENKDGLYDYFSKKARAEITDDLTQHLGKQYQSLIKKLVDDILVTEYQTQLQHAYNALSAISRTDLQREDIVNLLMNLPLSRWRAAARVLTENRNKQTQPLSELKQAA